MAPDGMANGLFQQAHPNSFDRARSRADHVRKMKAQGERLMDIADLKKMVTAAQEEFDQAVAYHEIWKPAAYDRDLHSRMGPSYASQAFLVMRTALRREMLLALSRLWDTNTQAVRMSLIVHAIRQKAVIDDLAADRAAEHYPDLVDVMRADLQATADEVLSLACKYSEGGSHNGVRQNLLRLRNVTVGPSANWTKRHYRC
jgi:hypothetical protein